MKVKYIGESFGIDGLTNGKIYDVLEVEKTIGAISVVDDSGEDYLYNPVSPKPLLAERSFGRFEVIEDDAQGTLAKAINGIFD